MKQNIHLLNRLKLWMAQQLELQNWRPSDDNFY
jgi:hypothetical protein